MSFIVELQIIFCLIVLVLGFFGNLLVIITFCSKGARLKVCEVLMISLAFADLLGTCCLPLLTILTLKSDVSFLGDIGCQLIQWLGTTSITASAFLLVAISIDRLMIVFWPLRKRPRPWKVGIIAFVIWIMASFVGIIYFLRVKYWSQYNMCSVTYKDDREDIIHNVSLFLIQMAFPVIIMSALYGNILCRLKSPTVRRLSAHESFLAIRQRRNRKSTKLFLTVVIVFYVLTLPYNIFFLWYTINHRTIPKENLQTIIHVYHILVLILLSNSCVNPLIYARLHKSFRRNTLRVLCPCLVKQFPKLWGGSFSRTLSTSFRWRSRGSSYRRSTSTGVMMSPAGTPSPCHSPDPLFPTFNEDPFSTPVTEHNGDSTGNGFNRLRFDSTGSAVSLGNNGYSPGTVVARVSYLKDDETVDVHTRNNGYILNETEGPYGPRNNGSFTGSAPSVERQSDVQF